MQGPRLAAARPLLLASFLLVAGALLAIACGSDGSPSQPTPTQPSPTVPPQGGAWSTLAPLLQPRSEFAVTELAGKMYVIGGYPPGRIPSDVIQVFDPATNSWTLGPAAPEAVHHSTAMVVGGRLFLIGGELHGAGTGHPPEFIDEVYELNVASGAWMPRAPMPTARSGGGAGVIDGRIYVAGGRPPRGNDFAVYDPAADRWTVLPSLPTGRNHLAVDAIGGRLYVAGGRFDDVGSPMTAALEIFDAAANAWTGGASMPTPRAGVAATTAFGCLYVIGGEGNPAHPQGMFAQTEAYDPRTNTWQSLTPMPTPKHGLNRAVFLDGRIHVPGGAVTLGGNTGSTLHDVYQPERRCDQ